MKSLLLLFIPVALFGQQVVLEDFKCSTGTVTASPMGGPTTIQCLDSNGSPQAHNFPTTTNIMLWGASGSWKPLNTQTPQYIKLVVNATSADMYVTDTAMMENTVNSYWQIFPETSNPICNQAAGASFEVVQLQSIVDSRHITVSRSATTMPPYGTSALASSHCNEDFFWGPLNRPVTWAITVVDSTHFSVALDSSSFGSFSGQTIHINRGSSNSQYPLPFLISSSGEGAASTLAVQANNTLKMTIDGCPDLTNAITCSFAYTDIFNQKSYYDKAATGSLVISGGTGTLTATGFTNNTTQFSRTLQANELAWLYNFSDARVNRPWVLSTVTGSCFTSCVITISNMGTGQGGVAVPDGTYTVSGTWQGAGNGLFFTPFATYNSYWGPGPANSSTYNFEYPNSMVKGTYNAAVNHYRAWECWGVTMTAQSMELGTYPALPLPSAYHGYHQVAMDTYGSPGSCQWQLWDVASTPYHFVGSQSWLPQGADSMYTGWVGYPPYTGGNRHYFDASYDFYMDLIPQYFPSTGLAQTSYIGPMYFAQVTQEPEEWVQNVAVSYNPGPGKFRLNTTAFGDSTAYGPCSSLTYEFYSASSDLKSLGLLAATSEGTVTGVSYGGFGALQMNLTTGVTSYGNRYFGVRPRMCVSGVSGNGVTNQISFRQDPNMQVGDHVTVSGVAGNTAANQTNVAIAAVTPRQFFYRSNQGGTVSPTQLTGITVTGTNVCTVNLTTNPTLFVGQEVGLTGFQSGVNLLPGAVFMNWATVVSIASNSFTVACPGSTNGTYNGDSGGGVPLGLVIDPAVTLVGNGNGTWDGAFSGIMKSTEDKINFSEIAFLPPATTLSTVGSALSGNVAIGGNIAIH